jgi:hypothetical protein
MNKGPRVQGLKKYRVPGFEGSKVQVFIISDCFGFINVHLDPGILDP